ncbi:hypothetical protein KY284_021929 [Solanum tuberosum]|nr:hypothetical protein KY284_021929 [Solanum tuberosum]
MPIRFWGQSVTVAVYLMNRLPSSTTGGKSPFEMLFSKCPSLSHLRVIGCLCYASVLPRGDKFSERARPAIMIGYSATQKGYLLLDYRTNKLFVNRDVIFQEHIFPFAKKKSPNNYSTDFIIPYIEEDDELTPSHEIEDDDIDSNIVLEDNADLDTSSLSTPEASTHDRTVPTSHSAAQPVEESVETHSTIPPRRTSSRVSQQPVWMRDYAAPGKGKGTRYPLANYLSYDNTTSNYQCYLTKFSTLVEPQHFG